MAIILGIESSCDDTSAAIIQDGFLLSNVIANQDVHKEYGGVVPELASRAHQQNLIPVVSKAIKEAQIKNEDLDCISFTQGPGLLGSLLVGVSFAKGFSLASNIPMVSVNHLHGHILSHFIKEKNKTNKLPEFPFLCLVISGGHTQLVIVQDHFHFEQIGTTIDDAAGEAFDKCAKVMGLSYPGGPVIDKLAKNGDPNRFKFSEPKINDLDFSFSGLKTCFLYFLRDEMKNNPNFIQNNQNDLAASLQNTIIRILIKKLSSAVQKTGIKTIALAGGVSANEGLRTQLKSLSINEQWELYLPEKKFTTDNAAMIAIAGYYKYLRKEFCELDVTPKARMSI